jgi:cell division septation protein DedD
LSSEHESSYYEIALTNRQVLTIFVVLLTCLVVAFLSGVWIGRGDGAEAPLQVAEDVAPEEQATAQMTELNFFSEGASSGSQAEAQPEAPAEQPAEKSEPPRPRQEPVVEEPKPSPEPAPQRPAATPPVVNPATQPGRVIQVFSTLDSAQAEKLVQRLNGGGYPAYLVEENLQGRTTYRVRVGPYQQEVLAQKIADELRREYRLDTWITSQPG